MAETAKILNPDKPVLFTRLETPDARWPMACPAELFKQIS